MMWGRLSRLYPGWTLGEIKDLTAKERSNWAEVAMTMMGG